MGTKGDKNTIVYPIRFRIWNPIRIRSPKPNIYSPPALIIACYHLKLEMSSSLVGERCSFLSLSAHCQLNHDNGESEATSQSESLSLDLIGEPIRVTSCLGLLLELPSAEKEITAILSLVGLHPKFNSVSKYYTLLHRFLSCFIHKVATVAAVRESKAISVVVKVECLYPEFAEYDICNNEESAARIAERELPDSCPICLNDFRFGDGEKILSSMCFHVIHQRCLIQWLTHGGRRCPVCRRVYLQKVR